MASRTSLTLFLSLNLLFFTYTSAADSCPKDSLKIGLCANVLKLVDLKLGSPPVKPCCNLIEGVADLAAGVCLCTLLKANVLGIIHLNLPINLSVLLSGCNREVPKGFKCA